MLRFIAQIAAYLFFILVAVFLWPVHRELKWAGLKNDCYAHASWMYDRIYKNPDPVDVAFVGSSHTICGIDDQLIEQKLNGRSVLNFGYCRLGRNLHWVLVRDLIEQKKPKTIVLEVREVENPYSHPVFPYFAENRDLISAHVWFNKDWLADITTAFQYRVQLIQEQIWKEQKERHTDLSLFGHAPKHDTASVQTLKEKRRHHAKRPQSTEWKRDLEDVYPWHYLNRIASLCEENGVQLILLFIPSYGTGQSQPRNLQRLRELAPVWLPPNSIWENRNYWFDPNHINAAGARKMSAWVARQLKKS